MEVDGGQVKLFLGMISRKRARESLKKLYEHKLINVLGSAGKVQC